MRIKKYNNKYSSKIVYLIPFLILISFLIEINRYSKNQVDEGKNDIENPTTFLTEKKYVDVIENNINMIHSDSIFSIYLNNIHSKPTLLYVYKDSLLTRQREDWFYVHVHLHGCHPGYLPIQSRLMGPLRYPAFLVPDR